MSASSIVYDILAAAADNQLPLVEGDLPATKENAVAIRDVSGIGSIEYFGGQQFCTLARPMVQISVRNNSYAQAQLQVQVIKTLLHRYYDLAKGIQCITLVGSPTYLGRDLDKLNIFQLYFTLQLKE